MKKILYIFILLTALQSFAQDLAYKPGEHFKFKIHYGIFNAGYATLDLKTGVFKGKSLYHAIGKGWTTGVSRWFMDVNDLYESYFDSDNHPYRFIRKIDEGGYTMDKELHFDNDKSEVLVINKEKNTAEFYKTPSRIHDMVSVFYYLRNYDTSNLKPGDEISVDMFIDEEVYPFKLKFLGKDVLRTKMGKIHSLKFRPIVQSGRIFKEDESVTIWISDDKNKMPLLIKAKLMVGSLKASLIDFKGLKFPVNFAG
jgi:hypothetical protein